MNVDWMTVVLAQAAPEAQAPVAQAPQAPVDGAGGGPPPSPFGGLGMLAPMLAIFAVFYFLLIRPESRKRKEREMAVRNNLKKGDTVVTTGGIVAKVWRADGPEVVLIVDKDKDVKVRFARSAIYEILKEDGLSKETSKELTKENLEAASPERAK